MKDGDYHYGLNIRKTSADTNYVLNNSQKRQEEQAIYSNFINNNPWGYKMAKDEFQKIYQQRYVEAVQTINEELKLKRKDGFTG